jgi:hypothetical protein
MEELHRPGDEKKITLSDLTIQPGLSRPGAGDHPALILKDDLEDPQPRSGGDGSLAPDPPDGGGVHPHIQAADGLNRGRVIIPARHVIEEIPSRDDPHSPESFGTSGPDPLQELDGLVELGKILGHQLP